MTIEKQKIIESIFITNITVQSEVFYYGKAAMNIDGYKVEFRTKNFELIDDALAEIKKMFIEATEKFYKQRVEL